MCANVRPLDKKRYGLHYEKYFVFRRLRWTPRQRFRLVGVGLSNFHDPQDASAQPALFI